MMTFLDVDHVKLTQKWTGRSLNFTYFKTMVCIHCESDKIECDITT